jgi:prevent-host-death family protein
MKESTIGSFKAKTHFSEILEKTEKGDSYIVTRRGKPVARIVPFVAKESRPVYGSGKNEIKFIADDFDAPLDDFKEYES